MLLSSIGMILTTTTKKQKFVLAHGTFIGNLQIEPHKPTQLHINSTFHFGASTRLVGTILFIRNCVC